MSSLQYIVSSIEAHPIVTIYVLMALVNSLAPTWDGWYNYLRRVTGMLMNSPSILQLEKKYSIPVPPSETLPLTKEAPSSKVTGI